MKQPSKSAIRYLFANFFYLLPFVVLPALMLTFFQNTHGPFEVLNNILDSIALGKTTVFENFYSDIFRYFNLINLDKTTLFGNATIWLWILTTIITFIGLCITISNVERHIRLGTKRYGNIFRNFNESVLYVLPYMFCMFALYELWMLLLSGAIALLGVICSGWTLYVLTALLIVLFYVTYFSFFALLLLTVPSMYFDGYHFGFAVSYSIQIAGANMKDCVLRFLFAMFVSQIVLILCKLLPAGGWMGEQYGSLYLMIVRFLYYLWWLMFVPCFSVCKYVEYTETKRCDLKIQIFD